jgi:hypothetical protein
MSGFHKQTRPLMDRQWAIRDPGCPHSIGCLETAFGETIRSGLLANSGRPIRARRSLATRCVACRPNGSPSKVPSTQWWLHLDAAPMPWLRAETGAVYGP